MLRYQFTQHLDSPERTVAHGKIIREKLFLRNIYQQWYSYFLTEADSVPQNKHLVEIGSGGGFLKETLPRVICTDILDLPGLDLQCSALDFPFENNSAGAVFMIDTFHHIPDSALFLAEAVRILAKGGKLIMIEPANTFWGRPIYRNFHHEPFNTKADWTIPATGPMSGANQALPWIVFIRDRQVFEKQFPELEIRQIKYLNPFLYLLSGGVSRKQLVPDFTFPFFNYLDRNLPRYIPGFSMFMMIKLIKR